MKIIVNGTPREFHPEPVILDRVLSELGLNKPNTVCLVNDEVVPPERYVASRLTESDRLDLLAFVGGG